MHSICNAKITWKGNLYFPPEPSVVEFWGFFCKRTQRSNSKRRLAKVGQWELRLDKAWWRVSPALRGMCFHGSGREYTCCVPTCSKPSFLFQVTLQSTWQVILSSRLTQSLNFTLLYSTPCSQNWNPFYIRSYLNKRCLHTRESRSQSAAFGNTPIKVSTYSKAKF